MNKSRMSRGGNEKEDAMAKPKYVTINLTAKQRSELRALTGEIHTQVRLEGTKNALSAKLSPKKVARKIAPAGRTIVGLEGTDIPSQ